MDTIVQVVKAVVDLYNILMSGRSFANYNQYSLVGYVHEETDKGITHGQWRNNALVAGF